LRFSHCTIAEKVVNGRQALALAIDLSFAPASYPVSAAEEGRVWGDVVEKVLEQNS
jgi:hypothetical protein